MIELKKCPFCGSEAEVFEDITFECETGKQIGKIKAFCMVYQLLCFSKRG